MIYTKDNHPNRLYIVGYTIERLKNRKKYVESAISSWSSNKDSTFSKEYCKEQKAFFEVELEIINSEIKKFKTLK